uniref:Uncharacterized protein n=1 Tax=Cacopsylla melanoneura TaxID=428564 RepID=A0A8D9BMB5_9HEMI
MSGFASFLSRSLDDVFCLNYTISCATFTRNSYSIYFSTNLPKKIGLLTAFIPLYFQIKLNLGLHFTFGGLLYFEVPITLVRSSGDSLQLVETLKQAANMIQNPIILHFERGRYLPRYLVIEICT